MSPPDLGLIRLHVWDDFLVICALKGDDEGDSEGIAMTECRICGTEVREGDDVVEADGHGLHAGCADAHAEAPRRRIGSWAEMGARGQMAMGAVQRGER